MARRLYIVRHAWAGERGDPAWPDDSLRTLTDEGRKRFACVVKKLVKKHGFAPELIATSPYARCRQTAEILLEHLPEAPPLEARRELEPGGEPTGLLAWTNAQEAGSVAWVGHDPDVSAMIETLVDESDLEKFPKGAVAALDFTGPLGPRRGKLAWFLTAKNLGC